MIDSWLDAVLADDWAFAALRLIFVALIYLFLFVVLRTTVREIAAVAWSTPGEDRHFGKATLAVLDAAESSLRLGQVVPLGPETGIGRSADNHVVVDDPHVSAHHAMLRFERGQWWLRDLGSSNGTLLDGELVRSVVAVHHGDVLQCGRVRFRFNSSTAVPFERASA